jgi:phage baseplate assembly protein W
MVQKINRTPTYSDLDLDFLAHPTTGDIVRKTGEDAIKRSVRNLILTNFYERKFRHYIGSNTTRLLFELPNAFTATHLKDAIREVITNYEPRVKLFSNEQNGVVVQVSPDNNGYIARLSFAIVNTGAPAQISFFLQRLR